MVRHTLKILLHLMQDLQSVSDNFGALYIKGLNVNRYLSIGLGWFNLCQTDCLMVQFMSNHFERILSYSTIQTIMKMCLRCSTCLFTIFRYLASSLKFANIKLRNGKCYKLVIGNEGSDNCSEVMTDQHFWGLSV